MTETIKKITINNLEYEVCLRRFDEDVDAINGAEYHGFYVTIKGFPEIVTARLYDDEDYFSVQEGVNETDVDVVLVIKEIAKLLFNRHKIQLLTAGNPPYKEI